MHILRAQQILYAAIIIIAASFSFSCENQTDENRYTEVPADNSIQRGQNLNSLKKENDAAFLALAANDVLLESQLAELAVRKAISPEVKEYAISVMTDHAIAMDELREINIESGSGDAAELSSMME